MSARMASRNTRPPSSEIQSRVGTDGRTRDLFSIRVRPSLSTHVGRSARPLQRRARRTAEVAPEPHPLIHFGTTRKGPRRGRTCVSRLFSATCAEPLRLPWAGRSQRNSAWASWTPFSLCPVLAAVSAAVLLALCEYAWRDRRLSASCCWAWISSAVFSGSVVLERVAASQAARLSASRTDNLPGPEAEVPC